jgi:hypothetical protein
VGEHSFVLIDLSEQNQEMYIARYLGGKTFQDLLELQSEPGEYFAKPSWAVHPRQLGRPLDDSIGGKVYTFLFDVEGEYGIALGRNKPLSLWACGPLRVIEAPSE